jgi:hypothetical protein
LKTFGELGAEMRQIGMELMADSEIDVGIEVYETGTTVLELGLFTAQWAAESIGMFQTIMGVYALGRLAAGFVRPMSDAVRNMPKLQSFFKSRGAARLIRAQDIDYNKAGNSVTWEEAAQIVESHGFKLDRASNLRGSRFEDGKVLIAPRDLAKDGRVSKVLLAEEIQHGLDGGKAHAGQFLAQNRTKGSMDMLNDMYHLDLFNRILNGKHLSFLTRKDYNGISKIIQLLEGKLS